MQQTNHQCESPFHVSKSYTIFLAKTRLDRIRKHSTKKNTQKKDYDDYDDVDISTEPIDRDKQMSQASDELLANDEIWFTDEYSDD